MKKKGLLSVALVASLVLGKALASFPAVSLTSPGGDPGTLSERDPTVSTVQRPPRPETELSKGRFLVASRNVKDPRFSGTVVLLVEYSVSGAMGLIINQPTGVRLSELIPEVKGLKDRPDTVYDGGPVNRNQLLLLARTGSRPAESLNVFGDVYISLSRSALNQMVGRAGAKESFRLYVGYAGWAAAQLDREVARGDWHVLRADAEMIFDKKPSEIWPELIRRASVQWVRTGGLLRSPEYDRMAVNPACRESFFFRRIADRPQ